MFNMTLAVVLLALWIIYLLLLGTYRVFFSPIVNFPGPRLAAITTWYQGYYDIWLRGQYFRKVNELHKIYGPVVRINPHELHIDDPDFIDELFAGPGKRRDKDKWVGRSIQGPDSSVAAISHDLHRKRRAAFNPYFSKTSIHRLEPRITEALDSLLYRVDASAKTGEVMPLSNAYKALTSDVINAYCFGESTGFLMRDDFNSPFFDAVANFFGLAWWMSHIAWLGPLLNSIPTKFQMMLLPGIKSLYQMRERWYEQIREIRSSKSGEEKKETVFHGILNSDLPDEEKADHRVLQEAQLIVQAGQETTATTLATTTFHLLTNPPVLKKLKEELASAFPNTQTHPTMAQLEQLPYLSAVIQEGLRIHPGSIMRMQRISPDEHLYYHDPSLKRKWTIPAGTPVSMDPLSISMNSKIFPDPRRFMPERWIGNKGLEKYLLSFSKGTRMCAGLNLAYAELYTVIAGIFRKYDLYDGTNEQNSPSLELFETTREQDVDIEFDFLIPFPKDGSKGIRVIVRN